MKDRQNQKGQVLLITIMLLAAAVTVVMTIAFNSTTETQITKLEQDSQKAMAAAEAALEAAIQQKSGTVALGSLPAFAGSNITGQASVVETGGNEFVTPLLQRDEQYTFYLSDFTTLSNYWTGDLGIFLQSETVTNCPALELTFIDSANVVTKKIVDPCAPSVITGGNKVTTSPGGSVKGITFVYRTAVGTLPIANMKLMIVRVLSTATRLGFTGTSMKAQGRVITSEAKTQTSATKKIELFQSYPQIPSDFFVTAF